MLASTRDQRLSTHFYSASAFGSIPSNMSAPTALFRNDFSTGVNYSSESTVTPTPAISLVCLAHVLSDSSVPANSPTGVTLNAITPSVRHQPLSSMRSTIAPAMAPMDQSSARRRAFQEFSAGSTEFFGAGDFTDTATGHNPGIPGATANTSKTTFGSVLGQAVVPGTTADTWWRLMVNRWPVCRPGRLQIPAHSRTVRRSVRP